MKRYILAFGLLLLSQYSIAASAITGKITNVMTYTEYGSGDVIFSLDASANGCDEGYWLPPSAPGFNTTLSIILSAYHAKSTVRLWGHDDQLWGGSADSKYCKLNWFKLGE